jgi:protein-S-isoprenylcysteine O-methyltransferase Ste14
MSEDGRGADNPGVVAPPPLIYGGALAAGLLANRLRPTPFLPRPLARPIGLGLVAGGLAVVFSGLRAMRRAGTNVDPYKPSTAIVTEGPYRFTRNPLYVGFTLVYAGIAALANALAAILLLPLVLAVMRRGVIEREEVYLEKKFGDEYRHYKARVRRWL